MAQVPANERNSNPTPEDSLPHSPRASIYTAWWGGERKDTGKIIQGGSNMTGTDLCVNKPHCAAAVRP